VAPEYEDENDIDNYSKGQQSEFIVRIILQELKRRKIILDWQRRDCPGWDFDILTLDKCWISFEVKSSAVGVEKHQLRYKTPVVNVRNHSWRHRIRTLQDMMSDVRDQVMNLLLTEKKLNKNQPS